MAYTDFYSGHRPWLFSHGRYGRYEGPAGLFPLLPTKWKTPIPVYEEDVYII